MTRYVRTVWFEHMIWNMGKEINAPVMTRSQLSERRGEILQYFIVLTIAKRSDELPWAVLTRYKLRSRGIE